MSNRITAILVTLNEEENIESCLKTLDWVDEIILVDNCSQDRTIEIAKDYTDKIYYSSDQEGTGDHLRKIGYEHATGDWIFIIDADEMVPRPLADEIRYAIEEADADVFEVPYMNYSLGIWVKAAGWWPGYTMKIFRDSKVEFTNEIHNFKNISSNASKIKLPISNKRTVENIAIRHFNHTNSEDKINRINRYTSVEARQKDFSMVDLVFLPAAEFINRYVAKKGYKLGFQGLYLSIFQAFYKWLAAVKSWELRHIGDERQIEKLYARERESVLEEWES